MGNGRRMRRPPWKGPSRMEERCRMLSLRVRVLGWRLMNKGRGTMPQEQEQRNKNAEDLKELAASGGRESGGAGRDGTIVRTSVVGIAGNVVLAAFKAVVGLAAGSIAIVLDAVNNLSDALSSVITIVATKLAAKPADHEHPFGYGRIEYLSAVIISAIVMAAGVSSLRESILAVMDPATPDYTPVSLVIVAAAVVVKVVLGRYVKSVGERVNSGSLVASGTDAMSDAVLSAATLVAAFVYLAFGLKVEGILGVVIAVVIIKSGIDMLREALSQILGERVDSELSKGIKKCVEAEPGVNGAYDLTLSDFGPDRLQGSIHIEVNDTMDAAQIDGLTRRIQRDVFEQCGVIITTVGIYSTNTSDSKAVAIRQRCAKIVWSHEHIVEMHGFYVDEGAKSVRFDVVVAFDAPDRRAIVDDIVRQCEQAYPGWQFMVVLDSDVSD